MTRAMTAAILVAIAMAGVIFARASSDDAGNGARAAVGANLWDRMQAAAGDTPVAQARATLRQSVGAAGGPVGRMPAVLQAKVRASLGVPAGVPFEDARRLATPRGAIWLTDLRRATCIVRAHDGALACDTTAHVARHGLALAVYAVAHGRPRDFVLFGLVPDDVRRARVRVGGGVRAVRVDDNVYAVAAPGPIALDRLLR